MSKIIRTPTTAYGGITAGEKQRMDAHTKLWISRAMRTNPIEPGIYEFRISRTFNPFLDEARKVAD